jgi:branched-chain amino acid aminotransferase
VGSGDAPRPEAAGAGARRGAVTVGVALLLGVVATGSGCRLVSRHSAVPQQQLAEARRLSNEGLSAADQQDLAGADEILLTSTPNCILPATRFNGRGIGTGRPGRIYQSLLAAWSVLAGLDIAAQARARAESADGSV